MQLKNKRSAILIISLWILAILVVFSLSLAYRINLHLKITRFYQDKIKARALLEAGLLRIIEEKIRNDDPNADYFAESWATKTYEEGEKKGQPYFKDFPLGEGSFTISYEYRESKDVLEPTTFYGLQDEQAKFNINKLIDEDGAKDSTRYDQFINLLNNFNLEVLGATATDLANRLVDWMDFASGDTDTYDTGSNPNRHLSSLEELQLIEGFSKELLYTYDKNKDGIIDFTEIGLREYITIHPDEDSKINVNTASREVLTAIFNSFGFSSNTDPLTLAQFVIDRRRGTERQWENPFESLDGIKKEGISDSDDKDLFDNNKEYLTSTSSIYRAKISSQLRNVKKNLEVVLNISNGTYNILYWYEN